MNINIAGYCIRPFVVTLQELPDKEKFIQAHFGERGFQAECFNGISAAASGLRTIFPYERDAPGSNWNIGAKPVATWLSFYMLWSALNLLPEEHFLTLEWDCKLPVDWLLRTERALRDVPKDFDLLYLGSCCTGDKPKKRLDGAGNVYQVDPLCGHATIVAKKALPVMLRTQRKVYAPIDISLLLHTLPLLKTYAVLPRIADQFDTEIPA